MRTLEIPTAHEPLSQYAAEAERETIVLKEHDEPIAAIVSLKRVDRESLSLSTNPDFMELIEQAREEFKSGKKLSLEQMKKEILPAR